jgi:pyrroloquinoline quinone biosynthesis protein B
MAELRIIVLGSAAGGGFPQWNCACEVCALAWRGDPRVRMRTQSSIAVTASGEQWVLLNCSPDVRAQIVQTRVLQPAMAGRSSPIVAVVLTNGDVDHVAGLLSLREGQPFVIYGTEAVLAGIRPNDVFAVVDESLVPRRSLALDTPITVTQGLEIEAFAVPGKIPLYRESRNVEAGQEEAATIGLKVSNGETHFHYIPACADISPTLCARLKDAPLVLFDGTLWQDDEMIRRGIGSKTGHRMGHVSISGPLGSIARLRSLGIKRKVFVHINNSNPVLIDGSAERCHAETAGWEIAFDGMEIEL